MKLKALAGLVCLTQALQLVFNLYRLMAGRYGDPMYIYQLLLPLPLALFFFHVWRKQKA